MKRIVATAALAVAMLAAAPAARAQTLEELLDRHFDAQGGRARFAAVQSARITGRQIAGPQEVAISLLWKRPSKLRLEFTLQGMTGIQAYDGANGWMVMPFLGKNDPEAMSPEDLKSVEEQADVLEGPLFDWQKKGHQVELVGRESVEGTDAWKIKVTRKGGDVDWIWLDAESMLQIKSESRRTRNDQELDVEASFGDYKEVGGLLFAHSIEQKPKGAPTGATLVIDKIELDVDLPDALFVMPAAPAAAATEANP